MPSEEKKALIRRFYEAHLKGDLDAMQEMMAPDFADRSLFPGEEGSDREAYIQGIAEDQASISSIRFTIDDQSVAHPESGGAVRRLDADDACAGAAAGDIGKR